MNDAQTKTSETPIRLALIGASRIASRILPSIRAIPEIKAVGVASATLDQAKRFASQHGIEKHYESYQECFSDPSVQAVYISTLNRDHGTHVEAALRAGKHVLCEKPFVPTAAEAKKLFALADERKLILLEGLMYRFHPQIQKLREIIASGAIGKIRSIRVNFSFILYDLEKNARPLRATSHALGGALMDTGCYGIDFIHWMLSDQDSEIAKIQATNRQDPADPAFNLSTSALIEFNDGISAVLECAVDTPALNNWEVSGTKGSVSALRFDPQGKSDVPVCWINEESTAQWIQCSAGDAFSAEFSNFAQAIHGKAPSHITPNESIKNAALIERIREMMLP